VLLIVFFFSTTSRLFWLKILVYWKRICSSGKCQDKKLIKVTVKVSPGSGSPIPVLDIKVKQGEVVIWLFLLVDLWITTLIESFRRRAVHRYGCLKFIFKNNIITLLSRFTFIPKTDMGLPKTRIYFCLFWTLSILWHSFAFFFQQCADLLQQCKRAAVYSFNIRLQIVFICNQMSISYENAPLTLICGRYDYDQQLSSGSEHFQWWIERLWNLFI